MNDFRIGQHEEAIRTLQADVTEVRQDTRKILLLLAEQKGERRKTAKLSAIVGAAVGSLSTLLFRLVMAKLGIT